jgi:hypothetical protein
MNCCILNCRKKCGKWEDSVEIIRQGDFKGDESLSGVIFSRSNHLKMISRFYKCTSLCRVEIPSSVTKIEWSGFSGCRSLNEIVFSSKSLLRAISGFCQCPSLCWIENPSSVEKIGWPGFHKCRSLNEIVFSSNSHLRKIFGLRGCTSLCRIEIPSSGEVIWNAGFSDCRSLRVVIIRTGCRLRRNEGLRMIHPFVDYEYEDMQHNRRQIHQGLGGRKVGWQAGRWMDCQMKNQFIEGFAVFEISYLNDLNKTIQFNKHLQSLKNWNRVMG